MDVRFGRQQQYFLLSLDHWKTRPSKYFSVEQAHEQHMVVGATVGNH
jgi:hypothetical protein